MTGASDFANIRREMKAILLSIFALASVFAPCLGQDTGGGLYGPRVLLSLEPSYPSDALAAVPGGGTIHLFVEVDRSGNVNDVEAFGPWLECKNPDTRIDELRHAAVAAAKRIRFAPATRDGRPVDGAIIMTYKIEAQRQPPKPADPVETAKKYSGPVVNGHAISIPKPSYPPKARKYRLGEQVWVNVLIDEQGDVISVSARSGHPLLLTASAQAACRAKFTPTLFGGNPVKVSGSISYNFVP